MAAGAIFAGNTQRKGYHKEVFSLFSAPELTSLCTADYRLTDEQPAVRPAARLFFVSNKACEEKRSHPDIDAAGSHCTQINRTPVFVSKPGSHFVIRLTAF